MKNPELAHSSLNLESGSSRKRQREVNKQIKRTEKIVERRKRDQQKNQRKKQTQT